MASGAEAALGLGYPTVGVIGGAEFQPVPYSPTSFLSDSNDAGAEEGVSVLGQPLRPMDDSICPPTHGRTVLQSFLQTVPHLFTLNIEELSELEIMVREYGPMNVIIAEGSLVPYVFVVASGTVEVMNSRKGLKGKAVGHRRVGSMTAPNIFGIDNAILDTPSEFTYHASTQCTLLLIRKAQILHLFEKSAIFANSVSGTIVQTLPAFATFREFCRAIFGLSSHTKDSTHHGYRLSMPDITRLFKCGGTVMHRHANESALDLAALRFSIRRLPANICETCVLILASTLPDYVTNEFLADAARRGSDGAAAGTLIPVDSVKRRRCAWTFTGNSQTVIMMRDGYTDVVDLVSCLCIFNIEAKKLRTRMQQMVAPSAVELLREAMGTDHAVERTLEKLSFSPVEAISLRETFGPETLSRLYNILLRREEYVVHMESGATRRFFPDAYANWGITLQKQIKKRLCIHDNEELPSSMVIDVMFSANRTFKNLFCSMAESLKEFVECYDQGDVCRVTPWSNHDDRYYYILTKLLERDTTVREAYRAQLERNGFLLMEDAYASALIVDMLDVNALDEQNVDPAIRTAVAEAKAKNAGSPESATRQHFIINVDKTFGSQIEHVLRSLLVTFGDRVRSVNLVGKAGGLTGNRGDIVLPSKLLFSKQSFGEDTTDEIRLCNKDSPDIGDLAALANRLKVKVYRGTSITIPGFLLQSETVLKFYHKVHGCNSVEMQSSYVARQIEECRRAAVLSRTVTSRFLFYMDDMPFGNEDGSELLPKTRTIISTIYATTRAVLKRALQA